MKKNRKSSGCGSFIALMLLTMLAMADACFAESVGAAGHDIGRSLPVWMVIPFGGILLSIALCPLMAPHFWHNHFGKVAGFWALLFAVPFLILFQGDRRI